MAWRPLMASNKHAATSSTMILDGDRRKDQKDDRREDARLKLKSLYKNKFPATRNSQRR